MKHPAEESAYSNDDDIDDGENTINSSIVFRADDAARDMNIFAQSKPSPAPHLALVRDYIFLEGIGCCTDIFKTSAAQSRSMLKARAL
jgi:hypothetical protein